MYAELLRLYQVCRRAIWRREPGEKSRRVGMNERHRRGKDRQTQEWQEALSTGWVMESSSARWQAERRFGRHGLPRSPTRSPRLITQLLLNLKCKGRGGTYALSFFSLFFSLPSRLPLSVRGRVCHATGAQPQTVNADKINFLMLIPVGKEHTEKKKESSPVPR